MEVSDRFGDYGLVGVMIFGVRGDSLEVDTFLLSCRVLGRGVEHRMVNELGKFAEQRSVSLVNAAVISTRKNLHTQFLDRLFVDFRYEIDGGWRYCIPSESAATVAYTPEAAQPEAEMTPVPAVTLAASLLPDPEARSRTRANRHQPGFTQSGIQASPGSGPETATSPRGWASLPRVPKRSRSGVG